MKAVLYSAPATEPVSLEELKLHLRVDSGSLVDNLDEIQSIAPGLKSFADDWTTNAGIAVEVLGYGALVSFAAGVSGTGGTVEVKIQESDDGITFADWTLGVFTQVTTDGMLTSAALGIGTTLANVANGMFTYFIAGVPYSKPADAAGTAPGNDVIPVGKYGAVAFDIGADNVIDVIEAPGNGAGTYTTAALAIAGLPAVAAGHVRMGIVTATKSDGAFTFGTTALNAVNSTMTYTQATLKANYNTTYEKAYTGTKRYIRTVAKVLAANCSFGTTIIRMAPTSAEDDLLEAIITASREAVEDITRRALITQTWDLFLDGWPEGDSIKLPFGNLQSVTHVKYTDCDGVEKTLAENVDYVVETNGDQCGRVVLPYDGSWPSDTLYTSNPIVIRFVVGWTTAALVPSKIKTAIKLLAADLHANRGDGGSAVGAAEKETILRLLNSARLRDEF